MTPKQKADQIFDMCLGDENVALLVIQEIIQAIDAFGYTQTMWDDFETGQLRVSGYQQDGDPCDYWYLVGDELTKKWNYEKVGRIGF